jgi:hypothetical protein
MSPQYPEEHESTQVLELRNLGNSQLEQVVADSEQVRQGQVQLLHVLSDVSPQEPLGQFFGHVLPLKKVAPGHSVQVVEEVEHFTQGRVQVLQVRSLVSPKFNCILIFIFLIIKKNYPNNHQDRCQHK